MTDVCESSSGEIPSPSEREHLGNIGGVFPELRSYSAQAYVSLRDFRGQGSNCALVRLIDVCLIYSSTDSAH